MPSAWLSDIIHHGHMPKDNCIHKYGLVIRMEYCSCWLCGQSKTIAQKLAGTCGANVCVTTVNDPMNKLGNSCVRTNITIIT